MSTNTEPVSGGGAISDEANRIKRIPLDIVVTETGARTAGVIVAVMASDLDASETRAEAAEAERDEWQRIAKGLAEESVPMLTDHLVVAESRLADAYFALEAILEEAEYGSWTYALAFNALPDAQPQPTPSPKDEK